MQLVVEVKRRLNPVDVPQALPPFATMVASPYLSPRVRRRLAETGMSYADVTGNLRIASEDPFIFIETSGAMKDPMPEKRPIMSLKGPAAARVVRALVDFVPPYSVTKLATLSTTPKGTVSRILALLEREALIERARRGEIQNVKWKDLLVRWTEDYRVLKSNGSRAYLAPRGIASVLSILRGTTDFRYAITGAARAEASRGIALPQVSMIYAEDFAEGGRRLDLVELEAGDVGNVILLDPLDPVAFSRTRNLAGLAYVAASQGLADLWTSPGRGPSLAEAELAYMELNEDAWRTKPDRD